MNHNCTQMPEYISVVKNNIGQWIWCYYQTTGKWISEAIKYCPYCGQQLQEDE